MIGILIVTHGAIGEALIHSASQILGRRPLQVRQVGVTVHDDPDAILPQAQELMRQLDAGDGVLVLTDIFGATPANIAARLSVPGRGRGRRRRQPADAAARAHLRAQPLAVVVDKAISGGAEGVVHLGASEAHAATRG